ncbi:hypothetical protein J437_LFUL000374 [Ladona fulva]|uniref:Uncharacterized protein n=1 Tax=Ladona fulva TaxID=123851 RepID=A0A8K0K3Z5_LADFU|nr:hypothetical protein J437_LFUL000374 [Ladona fulva]
MSGEEKASKTSSGGGSALTIDRAAFLLLRVKKAFKKKKNPRKDKGPTPKIRTSPPVAIDRRGRADSSLRPISPGLVPGAPKWAHCGFTRPMGESWLFAVGVVAESRVERVFKTRESRAFAGDCIVSRTRRGGDHDERNGGALVCEALAGSRADNYGAEDPHFRATSA